MVSRSDIRKVVNRAKKLYEQRLMKKSDFIKWLQRKGIDVSVRTPWKDIVTAIYRAKLSVSEINAFLNRFERVEEEYEREIIIREKGKKRVEKGATVALRTKKAEYVQETMTTIKPSEILSLIWRLYPGDPETALFNVKYILDDLGIKYKENRDINKFIESLSLRARKSLYDELTRLVDWKEFQNTVYSWIIANIDLAAKIKSVGGHIKQEQYLRGASGIQYRVDIFGEGKKKWFLGSTLYLLLGEVKKYQNPVPLEDIMVFRMKMIDILSRYEEEPDEVAFLFFSSSGYTDRAKSFARYWPIRVKTENISITAPIKLYELKGKNFILVAESKIK